MELKGGFIGEGPRAGHNILGSFNFSIFTKKKLLSVKANKYKMCKTHLHCEVPQVNLTHLHTDIQYIK